jgi:hypothetical protein
VTRPLRAIASLLLLGFALYGAGLLARAGWEDIASTISTP